jgi:hypothetical protein
MIGALERTVLIDESLSRKTSSDSAGRIAVVRGIVTATTALTVGTASASTATFFSSTTRGTYSVAVPAGVTSITITAVGGSGGAAVTNGIPGGEGGIITSTATVSPGEQLSITVGANGVCGDAATGCDAMGGSGGGSGGNGGAGAGGGGGSAVSDDGTTLVVGGGGGGAAQAVGGNADQNGGEGFLGGQAGTLSGPGAGGNNGVVEAPSGVGPNGGGAPCSDECSGGGGGFFGGGAALVGGGGGGASYPAPATQWDSTASPSVTITTPATAFFIPTSPLTAAIPGTAYAPVPLQVANEGTSTSPYSTTLKWKKINLPKGMKLSSAGVLSGRPNSKLAAPISVEVQVTETVTTLNNESKPVKTKTTVQATIPFA